MQGSKISEDVPKTKVKKLLSVPRNQVIREYIYIYIFIYIYGDVSVAQLVASMSGVVLGGVAMVVRSNLARGKIFTAFLGSVGSFNNISVYI